MLDPISGQTLNLEEFMESEENTIKNKAKEGAQGGTGWEEKQQPETEDKKQDYMTVHCEDGGMRRINKGLWPKLDLKDSTDTRRGVDSPTVIDAKILPSQESIDLETEDNGEIAPTELKKGRTIVEGKCNDDAFNEEEMNESEEEEEGWK